MQLIDMGGDHISHHRPGLRRWRSAAQTWVEPDKLRSSAGQNKPKYAGKQPKLDHCPARRISRIRDTPRGLARQSSTTRLVMPVDSSAVSDTDTPSTMSS